MHLTFFFFYQFLFNFHHDWLVVKPHTENLYTWTGCFIVSSWGTCWLSLHGMRLQFYFRLLTNLLFCFKFTSSCRAFVVNLGDMLERWSNGIFRYVYLFVACGPSIAVIFHSRAASYHCKHGDFTKYLIFLNYFLQIFWKKH